MLLLTGGGEHGSSQHANGGLYELHALWMCVFLESREMVFTRYVHLSIFELFLFLQINGNGFMLSLS